MMRLLRQLLRVEWLRVIVLTARYYFYARLLGRLRAYEDASGDVSENTVKYNLSAFSRPLLLRRTAVLLRPFSVIEGLGPDSRILVVGPRSEDDLLHLAGYGFRNVRGVDLISYSPHVDLGDMHALAYPDDSFDAVLYGWVLVYSDAPQRAALEALRVVKDGGLIGIGAEHYPDVGSAPGGPGYAIGGRRINTARDHLELFAPHVKHVFFLHDAGDRVPARMSNTAVIFSVSKGGPPGQAPAKLAVAAGATAYR